MEALAREGLARQPQERYPLDLKDDGSLDRSHAIYVIAYHALRCRWTEAQYLELVSDRAMAGCDKVWGDPSRDRARDYARRMWQVAAAYLAEHPCEMNPDLLPRLAAWRSAVHAAVWHASVRAEVLATAEAYLVVAQDAGSADGFGVSERRLAELAGHGSRNTGRNHALRLEAGGLLRRVQRFHEDGTPTDRYALVLPGEGQGLGGVMSNGSTSNHSDQAWTPDRTVGHDTFTAQGLGKSAWLAYTTLTSAPQPIEALAPQTGHQRPGQSLSRQSSRTLTGLLRTLAEHGLAVETPEGWSQGAADLDQVAETLGAAGTIAALQARHVTDREGWRADAERKAFDAALRTLTTPPIPEGSVAPDIGLTDEDLAWLASVRADRYATEHGPADERPVCDECGDPCTLADPTGGFRHPACTPGDGHSVALAQAGVYGSPRAPQRRSWAI